MSDIVMIDCINFIVRLIFVNVVLMFCVISMSILVLQNMYSKFFKINLNNFINFYKVWMFRTL